MTAHNIFCRFLQKKFGCTDVSYHKLLRSSLISPLEAKNPLMFGTSLIDDGMKYFLRLHLYYYLNRYLYFGCSYIQHHSQTIHPTENFISVNLLQMSCVITKMTCIQPTFVITWAWSVLTSEVVEAVRGQKHHISVHTLAH